MAANDRQTIPFRADGEFLAGQSGAVFRDELCDERLFARGQFFDLLYDFNGAHGLIIQTNLFLATSFGLSIVRLELLWARAA